MWKRAASANIALFEGLEGPDCLRPDPPRAFSCDAASSATGRKQPRLLAELRVGSERIEPGPQIVRPRVDEDPRLVWETTEGPLVRKQGPCSRQRPVLSGRLWCLPRSQ